VISKMGVEHVYVEYDPAKPTNRYDLGTRKRVHAIELTCAETLTTSSSVAPAPAPAPAPTILSFAHNAVYGSVGAGSQVLLSAQWENGTGRIGATTFTGFSGSVTVSPQVTTTYTLIVTNADGVSVSRDLTVTVVPSPTITSFDQDLNNVASGTQVTLTASWTGGSGRIGSAAFGGFSGLLTVSPQVTTTYTLIVTNSANVSVTRDLTVTVVPSPTILSFDHNAVYGRRDPDR
jgi:hypothetical protein